MSAILVDGGLATTLQTRGLPPATPVNDWLLERPDEVRAAHRAFVDAGARIVLAATLRLLPHLDPRWPTLVPAALEIARAAADGDASVWASVGPVSTAGLAWSDLPRRRQRRLAAGWSGLARGAIMAGASGVVLETFVDPQELLTALDEVVGALPETPVIACLTPREDGRLHGGRDPLPWLERAAQAGAAGVGFNCGTSPSGVVRAIERCTEPPAPLWAKPAHNGNDRAFIEAAVGLAERCAWVGGCCRVDPDLLRAVAERLS